MNSSKEKRRIRLVFFFFIFFTLLLSARLYYVQIIHGQEYIDKADRQYVSPAQKIFSRGNIFFTKKDGTTLGAGSLSTGYTISLNPKKITDPTPIYNSLSEIIPIDMDTFYAKASNKNSAYQKIAERVSLETMKKIEDLNLIGVEIQKERWRSYPANSLAAQTIGFVAYSGDDIIGRYGLEKYYENILGRDKNQINVNFFAEVFSNLKDNLNNNERQGDIITSIEPTVQDFLEKRLEDVSLKYSPELSGGIIVDPMTGEIYAMALNPTFNLNNFSAEKDISIFNNPLVEGLYEMGSIMKALTMASGLDSKAVTAKTTFNDKGSLTLDGYTIYNHDKKVRGTVDMQEVLNSSLNTGVSFVVNKMGNAKFADYMFKFGLDEETGIDLPGENHGRLENLKTSRNIEYATASFGQGISTTPIATVRALSALANGGKIITPHIVKKINYASGLYNNISYVNEGRQVISKEASDEISRMLVKVVDEALAGGKYSLPNYSIAAKTGTAQIAKSGGGYYDDRWLHSFFGYFPAYKPRFLVFLYTVYPKNVNYASQTLTEPFIQTTNFLLNYYNIEPDR
jgi:cell division protein FtsI/penicillin-binding protein 2